MQYINIGRLLTLKPIYIDMFWGFGRTNYVKYSRINPVPLGYIFEMLIPLRLDEREKKSLHSISIT